jgi:plasmid stability protein
MPDILIRGLSAQTLRRLKARAKRNGRSLQSETRRIIESEAASENVAALLEDWKRRFKGRKFSDSVELIREDRER